MYAGRTNATFDCVLCALVLRDGTLASLSVASMALVDLALLPIPSALLKTVPGGGGTRL